MHGSDDVEDELLPELLRLTEAEPGPESGPGSALGGVLLLLLLLPLPVPAQAGSQHLRRQCRPAALPFVAAGLQDKARVRDQGPKPGLLPWVLQQHHLVRSQQWVAYRRPHAPLPQLVHAESAELVGRGAREEEGAVPLHL